MTIIQAVTLAAVQGLTEFLPISSSAHLVIVPRLLGWSNLLHTDKFQVGFDIALHLGSLVALVVYFRQDLLNIIKSLAPGKDKKLLSLLAIATVPAFFAGFFLEDFFTSLFASPLTAASLLLVTGLILITAELSKYKKKGKAENLSLFQSLGIGLGQALAIAPGISRSGSTIGFGTFMGLKREEAARFSFLMAIPAITGAGALTAFRGGFQIDLPWVAGFFTSVASSYLAISFLISYLKRKSLYVFAAYCWLAGILFIILIKTGVV